MGAFSDALYSSLLDDLSKVVPMETLLLWKTSPPDIATLSPKAVACYSLMKAFLKKLKVANSSRHDSKALLKFLHVNSNCRNWRLDLKTEHDQILFGELKRSIYDFWNRSGFPLVTSDYTILDHSRCGPGASVGGRGGDFYTKMFSSPLTSTSHYLYHVYRRYIRTFQQWHDAEVVRKGYYGKIDVVKGSRFSFVPKNDEISRTICIEPTLNQYFQLGLGHILELRLDEAYGISMASQQFKNRELARIGSVFDNLVTIDLESASDSLSLSMLRTVLPRDFYDLLVRLRSPYSEIPGLGWFELDMVSTMGNGFTFPLQTMLFSCVVLAAFRVNGVQPLYPRGNDNGNWGVFGDDIICPRFVVEDVFRLLDILGFKINKDKTFVEGPFRESCGADFFLGRNVRGVYIKSVDTPQERYAVINQLNLFSTRTGIQLSKVVQHLTSTVKFLPVPRWENFDSGLMVPRSLAGKLPISSRYQSVLYSRYQAEGVRLTIGETARVIRGPRSAKRRLWNPYGLHISFLQRSINAYSIGVRHDPVRYRRKLGVAPSWDSTPTTHPLSGWFNWQRWDTAVYLNLFG